MGLWPMAFTLKAINGLMGPKGPYYSVGPLALCWGHSRPFLLCPLCYDVELQPATMSVLVTTA